MSISEIFPMMGLMSMRVHEMKVLNLGEENFHLGLHSCVGLIGGCDFGCVLGGGGCAFVLIDLEAHNHLIYDGVGVVKAQFVNRAAGFPEFKVSLLKVVFGFSPCFVRWIGAFLRLYVVFENSLSVEYNEDEVYRLTLG